MSPDVLNEIENEAQRNTQRLVLEQIDLEIGIRRRLEETVNSRMTWALQLQESLRAGMASQTFANDYTFDYSTLALETLHAAEAPILPVLSHEALPPRAPQLGDSILEAPPLGSVAASPVLDTLPPSRTSSRSTRTRGQPAAPRAPAKKFMYLRNTAFNPPTLAKLICSDCARSDMTNLQGLYNHYRLRHKREFGSHDECIRASAVKVLPEEEAWVLENGIELPGVNLPSLRTLFEMAVGAEKEQEDQSPSPAPYVEGSGPANAVAESTHLSRTLGHHIDTPALAPFLGREVKRRTIAVHTEDVDVDVENVPSSGLRGWRKPYMHRNKAVPALDVASPEPHPEHEPPDPPPPTDSAELQVASSLPATGSRFHFTARVTIGDRSLWIPPRGRDSVPEGHTHRCMVYIDSPSYSLHASAFISHMFVRSLTEPPPSTLTEPVVVSTYPFAATLTTDKPFLAEVTLSVVGERNPDIVVQHWVELDPFKHEKSVLGDEQVLDVELDRSTQYHAPLSHINPSDVLNASRQRSAIEKSVKVSADEVPPYARLLKSLLPRFPMTSRDSRGISTSHLPYKLVPSPQALYSLVVGRRKAIERARAQALCDAYAKARAALPPDELSKHLELNVTDVYIWLEDGGHFLRPAPVQPSSTTLEGKKSDASGVQQSDGRFCPVCGINFGLHPQVKAEDGLLQPPASCPYAPAVPRLLVLDPFQSMTISEDLPAAPRAALREWRYPTQEILHTVDPRLIDATSRISDALHLQQPLAIAGYGTLGLATRAFVRHLLNRAIRVAYGDLTGALGSGAGLHGQQLLTPGHILRAMDSEVAMKIVGSVLGSVRSCPVAAATLQSERDGGVAIKQELEG
ncbi:hypothetical protein PENSPDRAFT_688630 [Peniophora sp. CONT]|nr:hypothetical protein PENSPDRAFT_688630 [Peniophora sp. CONT]